MIITGIVLKSIQFHHKKIDTFFEKYMEPSEMLQEAENKIEKYMNSIDNQIYDIPNLEGRLQKLNHQQEIIENSLNEVLFQQSCIINELITCNYGNELTNNS